MRQSKFILVLLLVLLLSERTFAQVVRWDPPGGQLGYNQVSDLALVFENCEPEIDKLKLPAVEGLTFGQPSQSSETSIVNWKATRRFSLVYPVRPGKRTPVSIPEFDVPTDKGPLRVKAVSFTVGEATVGGTGLALDDISSTKLSLPKNTFWAGEVFPVTFNLTIVRRYLNQIDAHVDWQPTPLVAEDWSKPEPTETQIRGERRLVIEQTTRAYAKQPGNYTLKPASKAANLVVGQSGFGLFSSPAIEQRLFTTEPVEISVRSLPSAPPGFSGAVGDFALTSKIVPTAPAVGEPVTWTLELTGTGNWPDLTGLPQREVSNDFQVVQPKSKRTMKENSLFDGTLTEDVVLVPTKPGQYTLGPVKFTYFNTASGSYQTITTDPVTISVSATSATPLPQNVPGAPVQFSLNLPSDKPATASKLPTAVPPVPPENLPREPLAESQRGVVPYRQNEFWLAATVPALGVVLLAWLTLATLRSRALDPQRHRRAAKAHLEKLLAEMRVDGAQPLAAPKPRRSRVKAGQPSTLNSGTGSSTPPHSGKSPTPPPGPRSSTPVSPRTPVTPPRRGPCSGMKLIARSTDRRVSCPPTGPPAPKTRCRPSMCPAGISSPCFFRNISCLRQEKPQSCIRPFAPQSGSCFC